MTPGTWRPVFSVLFRRRDVLFPFRIIWRRDVLFSPYYTETRRPVFSVLFQRRDVLFPFCIIRRRNVLFSPYYTERRDVLFSLYYTEMRRPVFSLLFQRHDESFSRFLQQSGIAIAHIWALHVVLFCLHLAIVSTNKICRTKYAFLIINLQKAGTFLSCY